MNYRQIVNLVGVLLLGGAGAMQATAQSAAQCNGQPATIEGTDAGEVLRGTSGPDRIAAGAGNDIVRAYAGRDVVCGDSGRDRLPGGGARDLLYGGADQDGLYGRDGNDRLYGGIVDGDSSFDDGQQDLMEPGIGYDDCRLDPDDGAYNCDVSSGETH